MTIQAVNSQLCFTSWFHTKQINTRMPNFLFKKKFLREYGIRMLGEREFTMGRIYINKEVISYIKIVPRITKSAEAWLIKYCSTDLISIKLKEL